MTTARITFLADDGMTIPLEVAMANPVARERAVQALRELAWQLDPFVGCECDEVCTPDPAPLAQRPTFRRAARRFFAHAVFGASVVQLATTLRELMPPREP